MPVARSPAADDDDGTDDAGLDQSGPLNKY